PLGNFADMTHPSRRPGRPVAHPPPLVDAPSPAPGVAALLYPAAAPGGTRPPQDEGLPWAHRRPLPLSALLPRQPPDQPQVEVALGTPPLLARRDVGPEALVQGVGVVGEFLGLVGPGELLHHSPDGLQVVPELVFQV